MNGTDTARPWMVGSVVFASLLIMAFSYKESLSGSQVISITLTQLAPLCILMMAQALLLRLDRLEPALITIAWLVERLAVLWTIHGISFPVASTLAVVIFAFLFGVLNGTISSRFDKPAALAISVGVFFSLSYAADYVLNVWGASTDILTSGTNPVSNSFGARTVLSVPAVFLAAALILWLVGFPVRRLPGNKLIESRYSALEYVSVYTLAALLSGVAGIMNLADVSGLTQPGSETFLAAEVITGLLAGGMSIYKHRGGVLSVLCGSLFVMAVTECVSAFAERSAYRYLIIFGILGAFAVVHLFIDYRVSRNLGVVLDASVRDESEPLSAHQTASR